MPSYLTYKQKMMRALDSDNEVIWFTTKKGVHIPILPGQTKEQALNSFSQDPKKHLSHPAVQKTHGREAVLAQIRKENERLFQNSTTPTRYKEEYLNKLLSAHGYISPKGNWTQSQFHDLEDMRKDIENNLPYESLEDKRIKQWKIEQGKEQRTKNQNLSILENSFIGTKYRPSELLDGGGEWESEPFMKEIRRVLMSNGWKPYYQSGKRVGSSSSYYEKNGKTLRLSDHQLPNTPERQYKTETGQRQGWTHEWIVNSHYMKQLAAARSQKELESLILEDLRD